jgi:nitroreductase
MSLYDLIVSRRTVRRFKQDPIPDEIVTRIMEAARQAPSGANIQPLKYIIVQSPDMCEKVFENTAWAGYLKGEGTPKEGEKPVLYVFLLVDTDIRKDGAEHDCGAAAQNMMLAAWIHWIIKKRSGFRGFPLPGSMPDPYADTMLRKF